MKKQIAGIFSSNYAHSVGDAFKVINIFPNGNNFGDRMSPFFMIDYQPESYIQPTDKKLGVNVHPHRGMEAVTILYKGHLAHSDSAGHGGVIHPGDIQWMTAGKGILHKEYIDDDFLQRGGYLQMIQLWTVLPRAYKYIDPSYQNLSAKEISTVALPGNAGLLRVIAGNYEGASSSIKTYSPMNILDVRLNEKGSIKIDCPASDNMGIFVLTGNVLINDRPAAKEQFVLFENEGTAVGITAVEPSVLLILNGSPLHEPAVHKGPFVMNTMEEIEQAYADARAGKFGHLPVEI